MEDKLILQFTGSDGRTITHEFEDFGFNLSEMLDYYTTFLQGCGFVIDTTKQQLDLVDIE
jgi:hypothetical protein